MAGKHYVRETIEPGIYRMRRATDGEWVSTAVYYRIGTKQRVKTFSGANTATLARKFKADIARREPEQRVDPRAGRITLGDLWADMETAREYSPKTLEGRAYIRGLAGLADLFGTRVDKVTREMVSAAITATTSAPGMQREIRKNLSAAFTYALKGKGIELPRGNPAAGLKMRATRAEAMAARGEEVKRVLSREELRRLISETPDRYRALVELMGRVGLRPGEAFGLCVRQVDAIGRTLLIDGSAAGPTKTGKSRTIPIPSDLSATLWAHIERYSNQLDPSALVFTTESGTMLQESNFRQRVFQPASQRAGVNHNLKPYDLRHTALSTALSLGIDPATVANMAGHDVRTLLSTYTHAMDDAATRAADVLGAAWTSA